MAEDLALRLGSEADEEVVLALFDEAVAWLVARGQSGQWGSEPFSQRPAMHKRVHQMATRGGMWIAERDAAAVGVLVVGSAPAYTPPAERPELYVDLLLASRRHAGTGIGPRLVDAAIELARAQAAEQLRVDCWAEAPRLVRWYEELGFTRSGTLDLGGWRGQVFTMGLDT